MYKFIALMLIPLSHGITVVAGMEEKDVIRDIKCLEDLEALSVAAKQGDAKACAKLDELRVALSKHPELLVVASCTGKIEYIQICVLVGVDLNTTYEGLTPLRGAIEAGQYEAARALVEAGADVSISIGKGRTLLHIACMSGQLKYAELLIRAGAGVNVADDRGNCPLHYASAAGTLDIVKLLVDKGARLEVRNHRGLTPVDIAVKMKHTQLETWFSDATSKHQKPASSAEKK